MSSHSSNPTPMISQDAKHFEASASDVLRELIEQVRKLLNGLPGAPMSAADLARSLNVPTKLAWQLHRVATSTDVLSSVGFVPGPKPMRTIVEAARSLGAGEKNAKGVLRAFEAFERFVKDVGGNRASLITMLGDASRDPAANVDVDRHHRASIYKSMSHFYGMNADTHIDIRMTSEPKPGKRICVNLKTFTDLCRLRPSAPCRIEKQGSPFFVKQDGELANDQNPLGMNHRPLELASFKKFGTPIIPAFCSHPLPNLVVNYDEETNHRTTDFVSNRVGINEKIDITTGVVVEYGYKPFTDGKRHGMLPSTQVGFPVRLLTQWHLLHMPGKKLLPPSLAAYLDLDALSSKQNQRNAAKWHLSECLQFFEPGAWNHNESAFAAIRERVMYICAIMQWDPNDFALYGLSIEYPIVNAGLVVDIPWI